MDTLTTDDAMPIELSTELQQSTEKETATEMTTGTSTSEPLVTSVASVEEESTTGNINVKQNWLLWSYVNA